MRPSAPRPQCFSLLALAVGMLLLPTVAQAAEPKVLAVAAMDGHGELKKQLAWLGGKSGQPTLPILADSMLMMATQGRGLAGLDTKRPLGLIVTTDGAALTVHGYIPVKKLDQLLESLQASIGVAEKDGSVRRVMLPSGMTVEFTEQEMPSGTWAVASLPGSQAGVADPLPHLATVTDSMSIGARAFPSLMPEAARKQLEGLLNEAAKRAAAQGQPIPAGTVQDFIAGLADMESFAFGVGVDATKDDVFVEAGWTHVEGSLAAKQMAAAGTAALTVGSPAPANGTRPAIRGHIAQTVPADLQPQVIAALDKAVEDEADDPIAKSLGVLARTILKAMLGSGSAEAALTIDPANGKAAPEITVGFRVKDGKALEQQVKKMIKEAAFPENVRVTFDSGKAGTATLHQMSIDLEGSSAEEQFGKALDLTLAITPEYAFVLSGGDVKGRVAEVIKASGKPDKAAQPIARLEVAMDVLFAMAAEMDDDDSAAAKRAADAARQAGGGLVTLGVKPIERGATTRLSIDGAALQAAAAMAASPEADAPGLPAGVPLPQGFPIPAPVR